MARARSACTLEKLKRRADELHEFNPMLGHRGCRLGDHLSRDLRDAGPRDLRGGGRGRREDRRAPMPEIMIPLVAHREASSTC